MSAAATTQPQQPTAPTNKPLNAEAVAVLCADPEWNRRVASFLLGCVELRAKLDQKAALKAAKNDDPKMEQATPKKL